MTETDMSIAARMTTLKQQEAALEAEVEQRVDDLLAELAGLCGIRGPLTRAQIPDGILRKREPRVAKTAKAPRTKKGKPEAV